VVIDRYFCQDIMKWGFVIEQNRKIDSGSYRGRRINFYFINKSCERAGRSIWGHSLFHWHFSCKDFSFLEGIDFRVYRVILNYSGYDGVRVRSYQEK